MAIPRLVADINPGSGSSRPSDFTLVGDTLFFSAYDGSSGRELWKSDGTPEGTTIVSDINPGPAGSYPQAVAVLGETVFFNAYAGTAGGLW